MAGGMTVVTATGMAVGGSLGAYIGNSYMGDIYKFDIKKIKSGKEPAVITINGFLSEKDLKNEKGYQDWEKAKNAHFPDNEWYHVYWEAKKLFDLGSLVLGRCKYRIVSYDNKGGDPRRQTSVKENRACGNRADSHATINKSLACIFSKGTKNWSSSC